MRKRECMVTLFSVIILHQQCKNHVQIKSHLIYDHSQFTSTVKKLIWYQVVTITSCLEWKVRCFFGIKYIWPREMVAFGETPMRLCLIIWSVRHILHRLPHDEWLLLKFSLPPPAAHLDSIGVHTQETGRSWWGYHWRHGFPHSLFTAKT